MSDCLVKIIPTDFAYSVTKEQAECILTLLRSRIIADNITVSIHAVPAFIDCGGDLETILCPHCGAQLDFDWWGEAMDIASKNEFKDLSVFMPCCGKEGTLDNLQYEMPCGFACVEFEILNPSAMISDEILFTIKEMMGNSARVIYAHI